MTKDEIEAARAQTREDIRVANEEYNAAIKQYRDRLDEKLREIRAKGALKEQVYNKARGAVSRLI